MTTNQSAVVLTHFMPLLSDPSQQHPTVYPRAPRFSDMMEEPVYVNPKQRHGILKRRAARARLEARLPTKRKV